ncbi:MAG: SMI1/KNR4 family protein [Myxococcota bacterium]
MDHRQYRGKWVFHPKPPPGSAALAALTTAVGVPLPDAVIDFLNATHGGGLEYAIPIPDFEEYGPMVFSELSTVTDILDHHRWMMRFWETPQTLLPFARDGIGSVVCVDLSMADCAPIVAYVKPYPIWKDGEPDGMGRGGWTVVAPSMDDYLDRLFVDLDTEKEVLEDLIADQDLDGFQRASARLDRLAPGWRAKMPLTLPEGW